MAKILTPPCNFELFSLFSIKTIYSVQMKSLVLSLFTVVAVTVQANYLGVAFDLDGSSSHVSGPNCWNGALVAAGVLKSKRFIRPEEWLSHLEKQCVEIEEPIAGAVGRIFHKEEGEVHGFIHLDEKTIFAKHGEDSQHGYMIMSYEEMLNQYGRTRSCRIANDYSLECHHEIKYYHCQGESMFSTSLKNVAKKIEELVFSPKTEWFFKVNCTDSTFLERERLLEEISFELEDLQRTLESEQRKRDFIGSSLNEYLLESFSHQLYNVKVGLRSFRCKDRKKRNQAINSALKATKDLLKLFE